MDFVEVREGYVVCYVVDVQSVVMINFVIFVIVFFSKIMSKFVEFKCEFVCGIVIIKGGGDIQVFKG